MSPVDDGLDALDARAQRAKRKTALPPRGERRVLTPEHPAPKAAARPQEAPGAPEVPQGQQAFPGLPEEHTEPPVTLAGEASAPQASTVEEQPTASAPVEAVTEKRKLQKVAFYFEPEMATALDALHYAGAVRTPRVDVSKSAVVRLALERLLAQMSHEQIVAAIEKRGSEAQGPGRRFR